MADPTRRMSDQVRYEDADGDEQHDAAFVRPLPSNIAADQLARATIASRSAELKAVA